jgi:hypothetical protein
MSLFALSIRGRSANNRRGAPRRGCNDDAWIRLEGGLLRRCRVLDISRTGVRLTITNTQTIPDRFSLILSKGSSGLPARVKWRRHTQIGAEYAKGVAQRLTVGVTHDETVRREKAAGGCFHFSDRTT